jgi:RHS repeat-associated protein
MTDGSGTTVYGFDAADRVSSVSRGADVFSYGYDSNGNVISRTYPDGTVLGATFDDAGQQITASEPAGTVAFGYDVAGNPITSSFPNGVTRSSSFDAASRVMVVNNSSATGVLSRFTYVRDANGNPTGVDYWNGTGLVVGESQRLTYDNADRLTKVCQTVTTCTVANQTVWSYDKNGNRVTEKIGVAAQSVYTYDIADQLSAITGPGAKTFTYNANGDQITSGADVSTFNTARQTTGATVGGIATTFAYDGNGNRHTITTGGVATAELWDTVGGLPNLALERDASGVVQRRYTYGRGTETLGYSDPVAASQGWYLTDALGSVANITNSAGAAVATYTYNPFGTQRLNSTSAGFGANPLKYTGQYQDPTGNYNLRARQYNPALGRFTQTDPLARTSGSYMNAYEYANVNPMVFVDPSGLRGQMSGLAANPLKNICVKGQKNCVSWLDQIKRRGSKGRTSSELADATDSLVGDFLITTAEAAGLKGSAGVADVAKTYEDCRRGRNGSRCVRDVFFATIGIVGAGGAAFTILGGPANQALFALVDHTTDFAVTQVRAVDENLDAIEAKATLRLINKNGNEGVGSVRYWDGLTFWHTKGKNFWIPAATK